MNVLIRKQMKHVRLGCLSNPRDVSVLRKDPKTGTVHATCGTNTNEADNLYIDKIMGIQIGLTHAEQLMGYFFEEKKTKENSYNNWVKMTMVLQKQRFLFL